MKKVLIIQPLPGIGDMVWHLPAIHSIAHHYPNAEISVLTKQRSLAEDLLSADPAVKKILWIKRNPGEHSGLLGVLRLAQLLKKQRFDVAWIFHQSHRYVLACRLAGIKACFGFGKGWQRHLLSQKTYLSNEQLNEHPFFISKHLLKNAQIQITEKEPQLVLDNTHAALITEKYADLAAPWVAMGIGSSETFKQWGEENFYQLSLSLIKKGMMPIFLGGPSETSLAHTIQQRIRKKIGTDTGTATDLTIDQAAYLLSRCAAYIGNDTGAMNIAAAVNIPAFGFFAETPPLTHSKYIIAIQPPGDCPTRERKIHGISSAHVIQFLEEYGFLRANPEPLIE